MSKSINLSKNHGVNATMPICFWCGEDKGEIALLGKLPGDKEAPARCVVDYEPCDTCKGHFSKGVWVIEIASDKTKFANPPMDKKGAVPTGRSMVLADNFFIRTLDDEELIDSILKSRKTFMDEETFTNILDQMTEIQHAQKNAEEGEETESLTLNKDNE